MWVGESRVIVYAFCIIHHASWVVGENEARFYYIGSNGPDSEKCICS